MCNHKTGIFRDYFFCLLLLLPLTSGFAETPLPQLMRIPLETRRAGGETTLTVRPFLASLLALDNSRLMVKQLLNDYHASLSRGTEDSLRRIEILLKGTTSQLLDESLKEFGMTKEQFLAKQADDTIQEARHLWELPDTDVLIYAAGTELRERFLDKVAPELQILLEKARKNAAHNLKILATYDVASLNRSLSPDLPTVDIDFHICEGTGFNMKLVERELDAAREIYARHGLQLRLRSARKIRVPKDWLYLAPDPDTEKADPVILKTDFYGFIDLTKPRLHEKTEKVFRAILHDVPDSDKTIEVVVIRHATILAWEEGKNGKWEHKEFKTSAISFPGYIYADRIPRSLRGLITFAPLTSDTAMVRPKLSYSTLAHELGHMLINVSHEGRETGPQNESTKGGGRDLMLYGFGRDIPSGRQGRWQAERLQKSPFIYRYKNGKKVWNQDYRKDGRYSDPLYEGLILPP